MQKMHLYSNKIVVSIINRDVKSNSIHIGMNYKVWKQSIKECSKQYVFSSLIFQFEINQIPNVNF